MLRAARALRSTPDEVEQYRSLGLDIEWARTQADIEQALAAWAGALADERPDLLDRAVTVMAKVKGVQLPARLIKVVSSTPSAGSQWLS